jgi:hypothetical protein
MPVVRKARYAGVVRMPVVRCARGAGVVRTLIVLRARCGQPSPMLGVIPDQSPLGRVCYQMRVIPDRSSLCRLIPAECGTDRTPVVPVWFHAGVVGACW